MKLTLDEIRYMLPDDDFRRGKLYFSKGAVLQQKITVNESTGFTEVYSTVQGTERYETFFKEKPNGHISVNCTCPRYQNTDMCKHIAASMIYYADKTNSKTTAAARQMLDAYLQMSAPAPQSSEEPVHLIPRLNSSNSYHFRGYPTLSLKVGRDKPYVVKNIQNFLRNIQNNDQVSYGKNLTFLHRMDCFDAPAQKLIALLMDQFREFQVMDSDDRYYYADTYAQNRGEIFLLGRDFDRLFNMLKDGTVEYNGEPLPVRKANPEVTLQVKVTAKGIALRLEGAARESFFGSSTSLYFLNERHLLRCSESFHRDVYPLLDAGNDLRLDSVDMPTFCTCVLPKLREHITIVDPKGVLDVYLPQECTPLFYFDLENEELKLRIFFRYGEQEVPLDTPTEQTKGIKRNAVTEHAVKALADRFFLRFQDRLYLPSNLDYCEFLVENLEAFRQLGEVFLSDSLRRKQIAPTPVQVGLSVSDGLLTLNLDTGEFPAEELEALYQSLLKKKRYFRLEDGRYLMLDGSGYEKVAEMAHMLQLSAKDLAKGSVKVPAFRALYLDNLTSDSEGLRVTRDRQFRQMIRDFKSVSESDYQIPEGLETTLRGYQQTGFRWLKTLESAHFGGILADEMGLGKTLQVITYLSSLDRAAVGMPSLVVCPASLILNWGDELQKFAPQLHASLILGTAPQRKKLLAESADADVIVTSYELLRQDLAQYSEQKFYACILDEAQHIKNQSTQISKAVKQIDCHQRFILTGTPIENRLSELWNLFDFLMPGYLFSHTAFVQKLEKPIIKSGNAEAAQQLQRLVQPFLLRRLKKDVLKELPDKMEYVRTVPLTEEERKLYAASVNAAVSSVSNQESKLKILAALTQLRQICCDPNLCFENYKGSTSKLEACLELVSGMVENGHQVLLFSQFTSMLDILRPRLDELGISSFTIQGSTPKEKRAQLVKSFNAGGASVFLISLKAGGTGLNLTAADVVIHYDPWWNLAAQNQATDRAHRIGQKSSVQVYKLITQGTIEEKILQLQDKKAALMELISEDTEGGILTMSNEELLSLLKYNGE